MTVKIIALINELVDALQRPRAFKIPSISNDFETSSVGDSKTNQDRVTAWDICVVLFVVFKFYTQLMVGQN